MKSRRFWVSIITVAIFLSAFGSVLPGAEDANQGSELQTLQAKIDSLEETIKTQQEHITRTEKALSDVKKQLDEQIKENKRLRLLCEKAGVDTTGKVPVSIGPNQPSVSPNRPIVYRGQERTKEWFERMYERFSDKIICIDGKYIDVNEIEKKEIYLHGEVSYPKGTIVEIPNRSWNVLQALGSGEALIIQKGMGVSSSNFSYREPDALFHLSGYQGQLTDNQSISLKGYLISTGIYEYTTALGAKKMVQSFVLYQHQQLTREQFAEAISSGFELVDYVERGGKTIKRPMR